MAKSYFLLLIAVLLISVAFAQRTRDYYICIPSNKANDWRLEFKNDSIVEIANMPGHRNPYYLGIQCKYQITGSSIEIPLEELSLEKNFQLIDIGGIYFAKPKIVLHRIDKGLIDRASEVIYIRQRDFPKHPGLTWVIEGKTYVQDMGKPDGYGLLRKKPKRNRKLEKHVDRITKHIDEYSIEVIKGFEAYQRFGIDKVFGVIVVSNNKFLKD